jgi:5-methylcytosine-specific restriction protein A
MPQADQFEAREPGKAMSESKAMRQLREAARRRRPAVLERDDYRCCRCGFGGRDKQAALTVDHVVPVSKGGGSKLPNLQTLCLNCNQLKADSDPLPAPSAAA